MKIILNRSLNFFILFIILKLLFLIIYLFINYFKDVSDVIPPSEGQVLLIYKYKTENDVDNLQTQRRLRVTKAEGT